MSRSTKAIPPPSRPPCGTVAGASVAPESHVLVRGQGYVRYSMAGAVMGLHSVTRLNLSDVSDLSVEGSWAFAQEAHRLRSIAARRLLRLLVAEHCGRDPDDIELRDTPKGITLSGREARDLPFVSVSHSRACVVAAVAPVRIGVDIEAMVAYPEWRRVARCYFHKDEVHEVTSSRAFWRIWVAKEAIAKAIGLGLALPFGTFAVSAKDCPRLVRSERKDLVPEDWSIWLTEHWGYMMALAIDRGTSLAACRRWSQGRSAQSRGQCGAEDAAQR